MKSLFLFFGAILLFIISFGCEKKEFNEIKIGSILPLTGDYADLGQSCERGIELATEQLNQKGGVYGNKKLRVLYEDSRGKTTDAISALNKLVTVDKVPAIIGELASTITLALAPIAEKQGIVLLSPTSSAPKLSDAGDYIFRVCASDIYEGQKMAEVAYNDLNYRKIAVFYINNDYGNGLKKAFENEFQSLGGEIPITQPFEEGSTDFRTQLTKIQDYKVQAVYMPGYALEMGLILKQAKEMGLPFKFLSSIDFENPQVIEVAGNAAEGVIYTAYTYDVDSDIPQIKKFVTTFRGTYNTDPDIYAALSYDATMVLAMAIDSSGPEPEKIKNALYKIKNYHGITNQNLSFNDKGDVKQALTVKIYRNGKFQFYEDSVQ